MSFLEVHVIVSETPKGEEPVKLWISRKAAASALREMRGLLATGGFRSEISGFELKSVHVGELLTQAAALEEEVKRLKQLRESDTPDLWVGVPFTIGQHLYEVTVLDATTKQADVIIRARMLD